MYQNRYVAPYVRVIGRLERDRDGSEEEDEDDEDDDPEVIDLKLQVFDFDARRARKEKLERARRLPPSVDAGEGNVKDKALEGDVDGIELILSETVIQPVECLLDEPVVTGQNMPYILVEKETDSMNPLIDGQRILQLFVSRAARVSGLPTAIGEVC